MKNSFRKACSFLPLIVLVAFGLRIGFAWNQVQKIPREVLAVVPFQQETGNIAFALASGKGYCCVFRTESGPTAWLAPVYPFLLGGIFRIFGSFTVHAFFAAVFVNIVFSALTCIPIFFIGKRFGGVGLASGASWLWVILPAGVMFPFEWVWDTSLSAFLGASVLWATLYVSESRRIRDWCWYGVLWGVTLLTNPSFGAALPFLGVWITWRRRKQQMSVRGPLLAALLLLLCCAPWTIRNYLAFHKFIPLRSNFPFELWIGNNDIFDEHAQNGRMRITRFEEVRRYTMVGETAYMREKWEEARSFISAHPALETRLTARRIVAFWMGTETPWKDFWSTDVWLVRVIFLSNLLLTAGTLTGIVVLFWKKSEFAFPVGAFAMIFPCVYYATHTLLRYRHGIDPMIVILVAVVWWAMSGWLKEGLHRKGERSMLS